MTTSLPGPDEVIVSGPDGRLCNSLSCALAGTAADVVVTFGTFGSHWDRNPTWPECWGRSYPMCTPCWERTRTILRGALPRARLAHPHPRQRLAAARVVGWDGVRSRGGIS